MSLYEEMGPSFLEGLIALSCKRVSSITLSLSLSLSLSLRMEEKEKKTWKCSIILWCRQTGLFCKINAFSTSRLMKVP